MKGVATPGSIYDNLPRETSTFWAWPYFTYSLPEDIEVRTV